MKTKMLTCLLFLCLAWLMLVVKGYSTTAWQKSKLRYISEDAPADAPLGAKDCPKSGSYSPSKTHGGVQYQTTCEDILPAFGTIVEHDQIGDTWYDFQQNGSMGRMISVTSEGYRHFSWMYTNCVYPGSGCYRYVYANCKDPSNNYTGAVPADGGENKNAGYSNQTHLHDGTSVIIYHRTGGTPVWNCALAMAEGVGSSSFSRHWDIPDYITDNPSGTAGLWPKGVVWYDSAEERDYIHIVMIEGNTGCLLTYMISYERCYLGTNDTLICQCYNDGETRTYKIAKNVNGPGSSAPLSSLDSSVGVSPVVAVSPVSRRVAVAFLKPAVFGSGDYFSDVCYVESMDNCNDWIVGNPWPPPEFNITNYGTGGTERAYSDLNACYDYNDSLHIIYVTGGYDPVNLYLNPRESRLYHWSKRTGVSMVASKIQEGTEPGAHCMNIAKMSISAQDPIYHPGGDSVFLYCIWTQFDSSDNAANGYSNGDIWGCGSNDAGQTWWRPYNLTNTYTPGCAPGNCLSEHWSSLAQNMYDGDLHIQYICDRDAGGAIQDPGSAWVDNPVMYLHLRPPPHAGECRIVFRIDDPPNWYNPPMKVTLGGSRNLVFTVFNIGDAPCVVTVLCSGSCVRFDVPPFVLDPGDSSTLSGIVDGSGPCENTFINGNVMITTNDPSQPIVKRPVQAVVSNDYYECPYDPQTVDTLYNGVLLMGVNANCQEWFHDSAFTPDTAHEVFFQGGTFIATTRSGDTLVGRYMGQNDQHAGVRDKLYTDECDVTWEPDFWIVYTKNIFMHDLNPPMDAKWFWWEMSKQIKFFQPSAPDVYKHLVIKYITVKRHNPPIWWPDQSPFTGYEDTYIGVAMDIDCPYDTFGYENARNRAGYDASRNIAWQRGWDYTGAHPQYNNYYAGIALANGGMPGESTVPYGAYNVKSHTHLYPQSPWGWLDGDLYRLAADPLPANIEDPDSILDRAQVFTARKINAGSDSNASYSFTVVEVVAPGGLTQLQQYVDTARAIVNRERYFGLPAICGDNTNDLRVDVGDIVYLIGYLFKGGPPPRCPVNRGDCNSDGVTDIGDVVVLINYLFRAGSPPVCPGIWGP